MAVKAGDGGEDVMSEINITPFTDVLLVLLIIFMIAATAVVQNGFLINLPKESSTVTKPEKDIIVFINKAGVILVDQREVNESDLVGLLGRMKRAANNTKRVIIMAHGTVTYGKVVGVMDKAKEADLTEIALATQKE